MLTTFWQHQLHCHQIGVTTTSKVDGICRTEFSPFVHTQIKTLYRELPPLLYRKNDYPFIQGMVDSLQIFKIVFNKIFFLL